MNIYWEHGVELRGVLEEAFEITHEVIMQSNQKRFFKSKFSLGEMIFASSYIDFWIEQPLYHNNVKILSGFAISFDTKKATWQQSYVHVGWPKESFGLLLFKAETLIRKRSLPFSLHFEDFCSNFNVELTSHEKMEAISSL